MVMNHHTAVLVIKPGVRLVRGLYEHGGNHAVFKTTDKELKVDDYVVVETGTRWGMTVMKITDVDVEIDMNSDKKIGWVVGRVNMITYEELKDLEACAIDMMERAKI